MVVSTLQEDSAVLKKMTYTKMDVIKGMFLEMDPAYILALMFFLTGGGYIYSSFVMQGSDFKSKLRRELLAPVMCVVLSCFSYGLMTIASNEKLIQLFWAAGFISYITFLPAWIRFTSNMITIRNTIARFLARRLLIAFTVFLSVLCVLSNDAIFIDSKYGNQFSYNNSLLFKVTVVYVFLLCIGVFASHIKWWRESEMKRQRNQQRTFVILTFLLAPIGYLTDFFIPGFTDFTVPPLVSILLFPASFQLFLSMRTDKTLSITVPNVSGYIFKSIDIPAFVLDHKNNINLANNATYAFLGDDIDGKNIVEFILVNKKKPEQSFFDNTFKSEYVTAFTESGEKFCDMMLTIERDKYNDPISKVILLRDITEIIYRDKLLQSANSAAAFLLNSNTKSFKNSLIQAMETMGKAAAVHHILMCKNRIIGDELYYTPLYEWFESEPLISYPAVDQSYAGLADGWEAALSNGNSVNCLTRDTVSEVRAYLSQQGILSFLITPIFIQDQFWGFVSFNDCSRERVFTGEEETILHSGGLLFANALLRYVMESEIEEANKRTKLMLEATPLCCELWNSDMEIIDCNEAAVKFFGVKDKQFITNRIYDFSPEFQPDGLRSNEKKIMCIQKAFDVGGHKFEWIHQLLDGTLVPVEVILVLVEYGKSRIVAAYSRDLREAKAAEKKMLEGMERERDLEIQKQTAQAADKAKTRFLANMSHEIRTPMNAIIGMADLLLSEDLDIRQHRYAEDIKISSNALLKIINDILDLSKIQAAKLNLIPVHYNFKMFIDNISSMTTSLINNKSFLNKSTKLNFIVNIIGSVPECLYGDDVRLRQILLNILSNSVKYTKEGSVTLKIDVDNSNMFITVTDTGMGIPAENLPTLFDAFEQADSENNRKTQGTGLGLTITRSLVELMNGHISVKSEYGKGTSFHIVLPLVIGDKSLIKQDDGVANIVYAPDANVLVVDDRETNISVICGLLQHCHIKADAAISGAQAIEMVSDKEYDLIFMDHMMPEMDGIEATKILRDMGVRIPIIALTANAVSGAKELLLSIGMDDYLSKPIDKSELYRILRTWIRSEKIDDQLDNPDARDHNSKNYNRQDHNQKDNSSKNYNPQDPKNYNPLGTLAKTVSEDDNEKDFWEKVFGIQGLNSEIGLDLASGQRNSYKNTLEVTMREIDKSVVKLNEYPIDKDLAKFCIEVHGLKGSLSNIGATELASTARNLENASIEGDIEFCNLNFSEFVDELASFGRELKDAFELLWNTQLIKLPPELPPILVRITEAMANTDISGLFDEIERLDALKLTEVLKEEIENLKSAAMIMNYDFATDIIRRLLKNH